MHRSVKRGSRLGVPLRPFFASLGVRKPCLRLLYILLDRAPDRRAIAGWQRRRKHGLRTPRLAKDARKSPLIRTLLTYIHFCELIQHPRSVRGSVMLATFSFVSDSST